METLPGRIFIFMGLIFRTWSSQISNAVECGARLQGLHGQFNTPNYPDIYPNKLDCKWNITVPHGYRLRLNFTQFELEWTDWCTFDYVKVKASNGTLGKFCGRRSGKAIPRVAVPPLEPLLAPDNSLEVLLHTDSSNEVEVHGFEAHFAAIDVDECQTENGKCAHFCHNFIGGYYCSCRIGYRLDEDDKSCIVTCQNIYQKQQSGVITSPEYPNEYPAHATCDWHITAEKGYKINIEFLDFHIEEHQVDLCPYDSLYIEDEKTKMGPYCGNKKPKEYRSESNWLIVEFFSDNLLGYKGFKAHYWMEGIKCPTLYAPENGYINGPTNFTFKETVHFSCNEGYELRGSQSRTCKSDGKWTSTAGTCTRIICENPERIPEDGMLTDPIGGTYYHKHILYAKCPHFYDIFGSKILECQQNRTWTGGDAFCVKTCGRTFRRNEALEKCPSGRLRAKALKFFQPWLVAIKNEGKLVCSGILIGQEWVLTASHCVARTPERRDDKGTMQIILGTQDWSKTKPDTQIRTVKKIFVSRKFDYGFHSDVALIQLSSNAELSMYVQPICLPHDRQHKQMFRHGKNVASIGWLQSGPKYVTDRCLRVMEKSTCMTHANKQHIQLHKLRYGTADGRVRYPPVDLICTKATKGPSDVCTILPGSGLVSYDQKSKKWYLGGILTWGAEDHTNCKKYMNTYGIYSKLHKYIRWIKDITNLNVKYPDAPKERVWKLNAVY